MNKIRFSTNSETIYTADYVPFILSPRYQYGEQPYRYMFIKRNITTEFNKQAEKFNFQKKSIRKTFEGTV